MTTSKIDYKNIYYPPGGILLWLLIFLELITFGIALVVLTISSKDNPELFHQSSAHLNKTFGAINTIFLLTSGFFMATAVQKFKVQNFTKSNFYLKLTMLGGILFLILKSVEYQEKIAHGFVLGYNTFFNFYWLLTGFHVIHVLVGLVILFFMQRLLKKYSCFRRRRGQCRFLAYVRFNLVVAIPCTLFDFLTMKKTAIYTLVALILLTISTALISNVHYLKIATLLILGLSGIKFLLVAFNFMALKKAHVFWKVTLVSFLVLFVGIVSLVMV